MDKDKLVNKAGRRNDFLFSCLQTRGRSHYDVLNIEYMHWRPIRLNLVAMSRKIYILN